MGVIVKDQPLRLFEYAQRCGGAALMALTFYILPADALGLGLNDAAILLAAQTTGALMSILPWGWWGDKWGKVSLLRAIAFGRMTTPIVILVISYVALDKDQVQIGRASCRERVCQYV